VWLRRYLAWVQPCRSSPRSAHTDGEAYGKTQDALKKNEELTFSELEIDVMLPAALRRGQIPIEPVKKVGRWRRLLGAG
jgi:hypothetical protein